ncbi:MAG: beta-lactamase family protein [Acidobacteriota bacterium]|nr:beta-lactamase family protein [Acidobacteriota bacterium]
MRKLVILLVLLAAPVIAQDTASIDKAVGEILAKTGAPSASVAVVKDGKIAYLHAYGNAQIDPPRPATTDMRYSIGSISKQFTVAAILMLQEEGKLSLDDKVVRWLPDLTRAGDVTIRQLLSMTSGYQDFWPQDYVMPNMMKPVTATEIMNDWGRKPLDFEPGTKWQYSNTNYVIAGAIVEKVAGMPLLDLLQRRIFRPLHMTTVFNTDEAPLRAEDPMRYLRYAVGPLRPAPKEGKGWMFAAGELAMTAHDLALWDISMIEQAILKPQSYRAMETEVQLANGVGTRYGLGLSIGMSDGRRFVSHGGEVSGFTATNTVYLDDRAAVVVLTNLDATGASGQIATRIANLLFATSDNATTALAQKIFEGFQKGEIDRSLFTSNANAYFSDQALKDFASSLGPLGKPQEFTQASQSLRGGMTLRRYRIRFPNKTVNVTTFWMPDGKIEQFQIAAAE